MSSFRSWIVFAWFALLLMASGCSDPARSDAGPTVPRGYYARLEIVQDGRQLGFGPFVGYYFKPARADDLSRLEFICFNERGFYTDMQPINARLFEGEAVLATLPATAPVPEPEQRINPVFFEDAPEGWLASRPSPQDRFLHFHSAYTERGATLTGYWLRHRPKARFTYNMGGRLAADSPLYHQVVPGQEETFPRIIEFDYGPKWQAVGKDDGGSG